MPTIFVSDTFTEASDVNLTSHTPDVGSAWQAHPSFANGATVIASEGRVRGNSSTLTSGYINLATPPSNNYAVRGVSRIVTAASARSGYMFRFHPTEYRGYVVWYDGTQWALTRYTHPSTFTTIATYDGFELTNTNYTFLIELLDARITVYINGTLVMDVVDPTPILDAGYVGVFNRLNGRVDNFIAEVPDPQPGQLSQSLAEVILAQSVDGQLSQSLAEVILRDTALTTDANVALTGQALLDLGIVLDGQAQVGATVEADLTLGTALGTGLFEIGVTVDPADLRAPAGLRGDCDVSMLGEASLMLGTEINLVGDGARIAIPASARLRVGPETARNTGSFFLLF